ncbi:hypothetical protein [Oscillatoria nigro-viridis]|uniref:hypothetical protein n=1 Tax=Phormidium nigroviride TaxID=482564 RepID=UPI0012375B05|nr:hypothetical protein [Oscillatoria nigro-viridis]
MLSRLKVRSRKTLTAPERVCQHSSGAYSIVFFTVTLAAHKRNIRNTRNIQSAYCDSSIASASIAPNSPSRLKTDASQMYNRTIAFPNSHRDRALHLARNGQHLD